MHSGLAGHGLAHVWVHHDELHLHVGGAERLPLSVLELVHQHGVDDFVLDAIHQRVSGDLRVRVQGQRQVRSLLRAKE